MDNLSSIELQWLYLKVGYQDISPSDGCQSDMHCDTDTSIWYNNSIN